VSGLLYTSNKLEVTPIALDPGKDWDGFLQTKTFENTLPGVEFSYDVNSNSVTVHVPIRDLNEAQSGRRVDYTYDPNRNTGMFWKERYISYVPEGMSVDISAAADGDIVDSTDIFNRHDIIKPGEQKEIIFKNIPQFTDVGGLKLEIRLSDITRSVSIPYRVKVVKWMDDDMKITTSTLSDPITIKGYHGERDITSWGGMITRNYKTTEQEAEHYGTTGDK